MYIVQWLDAGQEDIPGPVHSGRNFSAALGSVPYPPNPPPPTDIHAHPHHWLAIVPCCLT